MSFRGLDASQGLNLWAQMLRENADRNYQAAEQDYRNGLYENQLAQSTPIVTPRVQYVPMAGLDPLAQMGLAAEASPEQIMDPEIFGRAPAGRQPMVMPGDMSTAPVVEEAAVAVRPAQPSSRAPAAPKAPKPAYTEEQAENARKMYNSMMGRAPEAPVGAQADAYDPQAIGKLYDDEIQNLLAAAKESGLVRGSMVHPYLARQIQQLRTAKLEAMSKRPPQNSLEMQTILSKLLDLQKPAPAPRSSGARPADPTIALKRKIDIINSQMTPRPKEPTGIMAGSRRALEQYERAKAEWEDKNADLLAQRAQLTNEMTGGGGAAPAAKAKPKKIKYQGKEYTAQELKAKFPEVYEKFKDKIGG